MPVSFTVLFQLSGKRAQPNPSDTRLAMKSAVGLSKRTFGVKPACVHRDLLKRAKS